MEQKCNTDIMWYWQKAWTWLTAHTCLWSYFHSVQPPQLTFFFKLHTPELNLSRGILGHSTRDLNILLPVPFHTTLWTRSVMLSLPNVIEFAFFFLRTFFLSEHFTFTQVLSIWITFPCLCWTFSSPFAIIIPSILLMLFSFVAYYYYFISFQPPVHVELCGFFLSL